MNIELFEKIIIFSSNILQYGNVNLCQDSFQIKLLTISMTCLNAWSRQSVISSILQNLKEFSSQKFDFLKKILIYSTEYAIIDKHTVKGQALEDWGQA